MTTRVTVSIPRDTDLGQDITTNTFHIRTATGGVMNAGNVDAATEALRRFYDVVASPATTRISQYLSGLNNSPAVARFYQLVPGVPDGPPYATRTLAMTFGSSTAVLPEETAACLSYRRTPVPGSNIRSERGRIFLGPLGTAALTTVTNRTRIIAGLRQAATEAGKRLQEEIRAIGINFDWIVWSPTTGQEVVIENIYMDDAFDTIRSRGPAPTARTSVTV